MLSLHTKEEGLAEHYLDVVAGPPPVTTRTRVRSARGEPPEWFKGAHGEAVKAPARSPQGKRRLGPRQHKSPRLADKVDEVDAFTEATKAVDPLIASTADALATCLGMELGHFTILSRDDNAHKRAAEELLDMAREAEIDPFEVLVYLEKVLVAGGQLKQDAMDVVEKLKLQLMKAVYCEYAGSGDNLKQLLELCEGAKEVVSRSEIVADDFLAVVKGGVYQSTCREIAAVTTCPDGIKREHKAANLSAFEFRSCLNDMSALSNTGSHYEQHAARLLRDNEREQGEVEIMVMDCKRACTEHHKKHEDWKERLLEEYMQFDAAHKHILEEIGRLNKMCDERDEENRKHEILMDEWTRKLQSLIEQKERRTGDNSRAEKRRREMDQQNRIDVKQFTAQKEYLIDQTEKTEAYGQQHSYELEKGLMKLCANEWFDELMQGIGNFREQRETAAFGVEDFSAAILGMNEKLALKELKDIDDNFQATLRERGSDYAALLQKVQDTELENDAALRRLLLAEEQLQEQGQNWIADRVSGKMLSQPPLNMPLKILSIYRDLIMRRMRVKERRLCAMKPRSEKHAECPARSQPLPAEIVWDKRRAAAHSMEGTQSRQCIRSSASVPSLKSNTLALRMPPALPVEESRTGATAISIVSSAAETWMQCRRMAHKRRQNLRDALGLDDIEPEKSRLEEQDNTMKNSSEELPRELERKGVADWELLRQRWANLWSEVQRLGEADAEDGDEAEAKQRKLPWEPDMLARLQKVMIDGGRHVSCLEKLEHLLLEIKQTYASRFGEDLVGIDSSISEEFEAHIEKQWKFLKEGFLAQEERQQTIAMVLANLQDLGKRAASFTIELRTLGDNVEELAFFCRMLGLQEQPDAFVVASELKEDIERSRFQAICLAAQAKDIREEVDALFGESGPVRVMEVNPLYKEDQAHLPLRVMTSIHAGLEKLKAELQAQINKCALEELKRKQEEEAWQLASRRATFAELDQSGESDHSSNGARTPMTTTDKNEESAKASDGEDEQEQDPCDTLTDVDQPQSASSQERASVIKRPGVSFAPSATTPERQTTRTKSTKGVKSPIKRQRCSLRKGKQPKSVLASVNAQAEAWEALPGIYGPGKKSGADKMKMLISKAADGVEAPPHGSPPRSASPSRPAVVKIDVSQVPVDAVPLLRGSATVEGDGVRGRSGTSSPGSRSGSPRQTTRLRFDTEELDEDTPAGRWTSDAEQDLRGDEIDSAKRLDFVGPEGLDDMLEIFSRPTSPTTKEQFLTVTLKRHQVSVDREPETHHVDAQSSASDYWDAPEEISCLVTSAKVHTVQRKTDTDASRRSSPTRSPSPSRGATVTFEDASQQAPDRELHCHVVDSTHLSLERKLFHSHLDMLQGTWDTEGNLDELHVGSQKPGHRNSLETTSITRSTTRRTTDKSLQSGGSRKSLTRRRLEERLQKSVMSENQHHETFKREGAPQYATEPKDQTAQRKKPQGWQHAVDSEKKDDISNGSDEEDDSADSTINAYDFLDVDVPLEELLTRPETPAWLQHVVEWASVAGAEPLAVPDHDDDTPLPPPLAYNLPDSLAYQAPAGTKSAESSRLSKHTWLPLQGIDAKKISWHAMPVSLVQRLSRSPSPERPPRRKTPGDDWERSGSALCETNRPQSRLSVGTHIPQRPHTAEPGAFPSGAIAMRDLLKSSTPHGLSETTTRPSTSQAIHRNTPEGQATRNTKIRPPSSSKYLELDAEASSAVAAKLPELPILNWLPSSFSESKPCDGTAPVTSRSARSTSWKGGENSASSQAQSSHRNSVASAPKTSVLARGFMEQIQNGVAICSSRQHRDIAELTKFPVATANWLGISGPRCGAAARRPR